MRVCVWECVSRRSAASVRRCRCELGSRFFFVSALLGFASAPARPLPCSPYTHPRTHLCSRVQHPLHLHMATAALTHPLLSAGERAFTAGGFADGVRADGRGRGDVRRVELGLGTLPQATGSAEVRLGRTHVVVGVQVRGESEKRARGAANAGDFFFSGLANPPSSTLLLLFLQVELAPPDPAAPDCGTVVVDTEVSPCVGPALQVREREGEAARRGACVGPSFFSLFPGSHPPLFSPPPPRAKPPPTPPPACPAPWSAPSWATRPTGRVPPWTCAPCASHPGRSPGACPCVS